VGGASAGAGSVNVQLLAYGGRNDGLFAAVHAESPSFGYVRTVAESQFQYDNLIANVNCTKAQDSLACLRGLPATTIAEWSFGINTPNGGGGKSLFYWSNCIDGDLIRDSAYNAFQKGGYVKVPSIYGTDTNEGTGFVPRGTDNTTDMDNFFKDNFPKFTKDQLSKIHRLFPPTEFQLPGTGKYYRTLADAYGEMRYVCSSLFISDTLVSAGVKQSYQYRWDVVNPTDSANGIGVRHTAGMAPIFGNSAAGSPEAVVSPYIQQYFTSFIRTAGDPNKYRFPGSPVWKPYKKNGYNRIHFPNDIFEIGMETVERQAQDYCQYFTKIGPSIGQ
jgi:carboxylesterase type B